MSDDLGDSSAGTRLAAALAAIDAIGRDDGDPLDAATGATAAVRALAPLEERDAAALAPHLIRRLDALDRDARALLHGSASARDVVVLADLQLRARSLLATAATLSGHAHPELAGLLGECDAIMRLLRRVGDGDDAPAIAARAAADRVGVLRVRLLHRRLLELEARDRAADDAVEGAAGDATVATEGLVRRFALAREIAAAREALAGCAAGAVDADDLRACLDRAKDAERRRLDAFFAAEADADADVRARALLDAASHLADELDGARLELQDRKTDPRRRAVAAGLIPLSARMRGALARATPPAKDLPVSLRRSRRRLRRLERRLADAIADSTLARRLLALFGKRLMRVWDAMMFWAIVAIVVLIVVEHYARADDDGLVLWALVADTAICAVLLWDFAVRVALTPRRGRYVLRHAITDLLPALPFGLLAQIPRLGGAGDLGLVRALRLIRLGPRVLRFLQPIARILRLLLFLARAVDRLFERNAWLLNRDLVFFGDVDGGGVAHPIEERARELDRFIARETALVVASASVELVLAHAERRTLAIAAALAAPGELGSASASRGGGTAREIRVDEAVRLLRELDERQVAETVGLDVAESVTSSLRILDLPLIRRLPVARYVVGSGGRDDPLAITARVGRVCGDLLAFSQRAVNAFADLQGTITGAQFLDRFGMHLVRATAPPARRVATILVIVALIWLVIRLINLPQVLDDVMDGALDFVSLPLLLIAGACLLPLLLGLWFRRIAGQAADFFERVAEAQFLALTELGKEKKQGRDLQVLAERVLLPEARLKEVAGPDGEERLKQRLAGGLPALTHLLDEQVRAGTSLLPATQTELVVLFYRDFLDGAPFHRNDTKVAGMLLGNLTLENVRRHRLRSDRRERRRLDRLDVIRGRGGIGSSRMWFGLITKSIAVQTARLVIDYNRHVVPRDELESAPAADRDAYRLWLERRRRVFRLRSQGIETRDELPGAHARTAARTGPLYRVTEFNALHFLTVDETREGVVAARYGDELLELLRADREHLIRGVFGTFPMARLPRERRVFNPYRFWSRWGARGRVFLAPFSALLGALRLARILGSRVVAIVKDVLDPAARPLETASGRADFAVARRKLHRMRRPVAMEALRMRAAYDVEYAGLEIPACPRSLQVRGTLSEDLVELEASEREWERLRAIKARSERRLRGLGRLLAQAAAPHGGDVRSWLAAERPALAPRLNEALRAIAVAFATDHREAASAWDARERLRALVREEASELAAPRRRWMGRPPRIAEPVWQEIAEAGAADAALRSRAAATIAARGMRRDLSRLAARLEPGRSLASTLIALLLEVAERPSSWTEEIVAVRTVQTLAMLDLRGYEEEIFALGRYGKKAP